MTEADYADTLRTVVSQYAAGKTVNEIRKTLNVPPKLVKTVLACWRKIDKQGQGARAPNCFPLKGYDSLYVDKFFVPIIRRQDKKKRGAYFSPTVARRTDDDRKRILSRINKIRHELGQGASRADVIRLVVNEFSMSPEMAYRYVDVSIQFNMAQNHITTAEARADSLTWWQSEMRMATRMAEQGQALMTRASNMLERVEAFIRKIEDEPQTKKERQDTLRSLSSTLVELQDLHDKGQRMFEAAREDRRSIKKHEERLRRLDVPLNGGDSDQLDEPAPHVPGLPGMEAVDEEEAFTLGGATLAFQELLQKPAVRKLLGGPETKEGTQ